MPSDHKVKEWLSKQKGSGILSNQDEVLKHVESWHLDHIWNEKSIIHFDNRFTISESGAIGISSEEQPRLSIIYPDTQKPPLILTTNKSHRFATFIKSFDREYLATATIIDNGLHIWDINTKSSRKISNSLLPVRTYASSIFVVDNKTVGYGEANPACDKSFKVSLVNTESDTEEQWPSSSLTLSTKSGRICDMCHIKMSDGTACLLLCFHKHRCVQAVEVIGGKIRWETGRHQMGFPLSICTDENNTVYVSERNGFRFHVLSGEDGSVIRSINLWPYGIYNLLCVRFQKEYLYMMHKKFDGPYAISKFSIIQDEYDV